MSKPFFYRITAADFLAAVIQVPEADRGEWALNLGLDMVAGNLRTAKSEFAKTIITEAAEFSEKKRSAANKRWNAKDKQSDAVHNHSNARSSTEAVTVTETEKKEPKPLPPEALRLSEQLAEMILFVNPNNASLLPAKRAKTIDSWARDIEKAMRIDKRTEQQISDLITWVGEDDFWRVNIQSGSKLREKFDQIAPKMKIHQSSPPSSGRFSQYDNI